MKNTSNIKAATATVILAIMVGCLVFVAGCAGPESISSKTREQLWSENCNRCHNAPPSSNFSNDQWDAAMEHMHQKAILTDTEAQKIVAFLKGQ